MRPRVLYCGMAYDIIAPLKLVPDAEVFFSIDLLDRAFSPDGTLEGQRQYLLHWLVGEGGVVESVGMAGKAWVVHFRFQGKASRLVCYQQNYYKKWPEDVVGITDLMSMGADFSRRKAKKMILERCVFPLRYYQIAYSWLEYDKIFNLGVDKPELEEFGEQRDVLVGMNWVGPSLEGIHHV